MKFSADEINKIIGLKGADGKQIDIFHLHGLLFVGNSENGTWDLSKTYVRLNEHTLSISLEDFEDCETEEEVNEQYMESLKDTVAEKLLYRG